MQSKMLELIKQRRTSFHFSERKVKNSDIKKILQAAQYAPSSHNAQDWKFILVKNKEKIKKLLRTCNYGAFHTAPSAVIAIVMEPLYSKKPGLLRGQLATYAESHMYINIGSAMTHIVLMAQSLGINTAILSSETKSAGKILKIPAGCEVDIVVALGYEPKGAFHIPKNRKNLSEVAVMEEYRGAKIK